MTPSGRLASPEEDDGAEPWADLDWKGRDWGGWDCAGAAALVVAPPFGAATESMFLGAPIM